MRKIVSLITALLILVLPVKANDIEKIISKQHINSGAVSISVKNADTGEKVYSLNDKTPRQPASTLKIITAAAALDTLGKDYEFLTALYKSTNNDLYIKLGADPFLQSADLKTLIIAAKNKNIVPKNLYVDKTIFDDIEWGEGWQWDDDLNPLMPKFSAYNLDGNLLNIEITPQINGSAPSVTIKPFYPVTIMNLVKTQYDERNNIKLSRNNSIAPNIISAEGTISKQQIMQIPVNNPQLYFNLRLQDALKNRKFEYYDQIKTGTLPDKNVYLVEKVSHGMSEALNEMLKNSNNLVAETLFKLAGAQFAGSAGSFENSSKMLSEYFSKLELNTEDIKVVDGSGVSKNNIVTSDFMTNFLVKLYKSGDILEFLPTAGEGTLKNRMLYFKGNLHAKTGTLSNTSAITGYITSRRGKNYVFNIMIQDAKTSETDKKIIEELILRQIYMMK